MYVLVIENDPVDQQLINTVLQKTELDMRVSFASSPAELSKNCPYKSYDFIFISYNLPGTNGVDYTKYLRERGCTCTIVLITENDNILIAEQAIEAGANNYITKELLHPFVLRSIIRSSLNINKSEQKIWTLLQRQENIIQSANIGTWEWDLLNDKAVLNDKWFQILGYNREDLEPMNNNKWVQMVHPDDIEKSQNLLVKCFKREIDFYDNELRLKSKNGEWIWIHDKGKIVEWDADGKAIKMFGTLSNIHERRTQSEKVLQLKELLERTNHAARIGTWESNFDTKELYLSKILKDILEIAPEENPPLDIAVDMCKEGYHREKMKKSIQQLATTGKSFSGDYLLITAKGKEIWIRVIGLAEFKNGVCVRIYGSTQDIDGHKSIELQLLNSQRKIKSIISTIPGITYRCKNDPTYTMEFMSDEMERMTGYPVADFINNAKKTFSDIIHPDDIEHVVQKINEGVKNKSIYEFTYRIICLDESIKWVYEKGHGIYNEQHQVEYLEGVILDYTPQKQTEKELAKTQEMLEQSNQAARIGTWEIDIATHLLHLSKVTREIHELPEDEILYFEDILKFYEDKIYRKKLIEVFYAAIEHGDNFDTEVELVTAEGHKIWVRIIGLVQVNENHQKRLYGTFQDINNQKRIEEELVKAKEIAEQSVAIKNDFLANMSHEIRTPMNAIMGFSDILKQTHLDENQKECVETIGVAANNLLYIINDILDFSKIESGKMKIVNEPFDLKETIQRVEKLLIVRIKEKGLDYRFESSEDLPQYLLGDSVRLSQILVNLIGNAIKFTHKGFIQFSVMLLQQDQDSCTIKFSIKDTGIGMSKDKLDYIFERFTQAESFITRKYGGTGLGLSISKSLIELQGGQLQVISEPEQGSEFYFELSFKKSDKIQSKTEETQITNIKANKEVKILLFEDNLFNQRLAIKSVESFGFSIDAAIDGEIGLALLKQNTYDLILMDLQMPGMSGYDVTRVIREDLKMNIPIIAMTAHSLVGEKDRCLEAGMNDYLSKPFKQDDLKEKINEVLQRTNEHTLKKESATIKPNNMEPAINVSYLKELSNGDKSFEKELLDLFLNDTSKDMHLIKESFGQKNINKIREISHKIKPSLQVIGATLLQQKIDLLKRKIMEEDIYDDVLCQDVLNEFSKCETEINELLTKDYA